jgi:hypothetical protein
MPAGWINAENPVWLQAIGPEIDRWPRLPLRALLSARTLHLCVDMQRILRRAGCGQRHGIGAAGRD